MRSRHALLMVFVAVFAFIGLQSQAFADKDVYKLATHAAYKPWEFIDEKGDFAGIEIEMIEAIEASQNIEIEVANMPWDACIASTTQGKVDGMFGGMSITEERKRVMDYTRPIYRVDFAVVVHEDSDLNPVTALTHGAVTSANSGTTGASWVRENLVEKGFDTKLKVYDSYVAALQAVIKGKIDSVFVDAPTAESYVKEMPLKIVGTVSSNEYLAWAVPEGDPDGLLPILNAGLNKMIESGKMAEIYSKWGLPPSIPQAGPEQE
ncbi:MAG: transporter substrate-binding domain-containing protein [Desulfohalobiaceae bacterium]|nr:transporter substrate-binding domain-containing protein [Desulfohalobiaceae bacterium]